MAVDKPKVKKGKAKEPSFLIKAEEPSFVVKVEEPSFVVKAGCGSKTKASDKPWFMVLAGRRGVGMPELNKVEYSSDEEFDSDKDPEVSYAKICNRFEWRTRKMLAALPWLTFESDASILKRQEDYKREQELKTQQEEVSVVV